TWRLGTHSYLTYLRDRLKLARELLADSGSIFVQISDENAHYVRQLAQEVFGRDNFVVTINLKKKGNQKGGRLESITDYILYLAKNRDRVKYHDIFTPKPVSNDGFVADQLTSGGVFRTQIYPYTFRGRVFRPATGNSWKVAEDGMRRLD